MEKEFMDLIGYEGSIIDLSNELQVRECEDICDFGNWEDILDSGDVVVSDELGENNIQIFFEVIFRSGEGVPEESIIRIVNVENY